jgi:hypothetical protein
MAKDPDDLRLREIVEEIILAQNGAISISPTWVAGQAMVKLDPTHETQASIYLAANLQFRQVARQQLGKKFEPEDDEIPAQHPLWPDLQQRYPIPTKRSEERQYKLLEYLSHTERLFNIARLRKEASGKLHHADALQAYDELKIDRDPVEAA